MVFQHSFSLSHCISASAGDGCGTERAETKDGPSKTVSFMGKYMRQSVSFDPFRFRASIVLRVEISRVLVRLVVVSSALSPWFSRREARLASVVRRNGKMRFGKVD